jgi:hypothetical protein
VRIGKILEGLCASIREDKEKYAHVHTNGRLEGDIGINTEHWVGLGKEYAGKAT